MLKFAYIIGLILLCKITQVSADLVVIVHPDTPVKKLSETQIKRLYLGKTRVVGDNIRLIPIHQARNRPARRQFEEKVLLKTAKQLRSYWVEQVFTGKGAPPASEGDDKSVKHLIAKEKGFIGYVDQRFLDETVKVVYSIP